MAERAVTAFVLASGSAGRLRVLRDAGMDPQVVISGVDETNEHGLGATALVEDLARRKASAVAASRPDALVVGCDSLLDLDGAALGKPESADEAFSVWRRLCGREGTLLTGHCLIDAPTGRQVSGVGRTVIRFGTPTEAELAAYVSSGEPLAVAGAFSIDGLGAPFVESIDGDPSNVVGLSLPLFRRMLADLGITITDLWRDSPAQATAVAGRDRGSVSVTRRPFG